MGGRGSASSKVKWDWKNEFEFDKDTKLINKNPIGKDNQKMFHDTLKNVTSIFPILEVEKLNPVTVTGALGVAVIGVDMYPSDSNPDKTILKGDIQIGFDDKVFATQYSLAETIENNFESNWNSTALDNHIVTHEIGHMLDYQLSIKKNAGISHGRLILHLILSGRVRC